MAELRWGPWELSGVCVSRRCLDDEAKRDHKIIPQCLAMPTMQQHAYWKGVGRSDFLTTMGVDIPVESMEQAQALADLFHTHYALGASAAKISAVVQEANRKDTTNA